MTSLNEKYKNLTKKDYEAIAEPFWPKFEDFSKHIDNPEQIYADIDKMLDLSKTQE